MNPKAKWVRKEDFIPKLLDALEQSPLVQEEIRHIVMTQLSALPALPASDEKINPDTAEPDLAEHTNFTPDPDFPTNPDFMPNSDLTPNPSLTAGPDFSASPDFTANSNLTAHPNVSANPNFAAAPDLALDPGFPIHPELNLTPRQSLMDTPDMTDAPDFISTSDFSAKGYSTLQETSRPSQLLLIAQEKISQLEGEIARLENENRNLRLTAARLENTNQNLLDNTSQLEGLNQNLQEDAADLNAEVQRLTREGLQLTQTNQELLDENCRIEQLYQALKEKYIYLVKRGKESDKENANLLTRLTDANWQLDPFRELLEIYTSYRSLPEELREDVQAILPGENPMKFLIGGCQAENLLTIWDYVCSHAEELKSWELETWKEILRFFFRYVNTPDGEPIYELLENEKGMPFDERRHQKSEACLRYGSRFGEKIDTVLWPGIENRSKNTIEKKTLVHKIF